MKRYLILLTVALSLFFVQTATANLVTNGGFETASGIGDALIGWDYPVEQSGTYVDDENPHSGTYAALLGPDKSGYISQTLPTTAGASYTLSFWLANENFGEKAINSCSVEWDSNPPLMSLTNAPDFDYTQYTFMVTATSDSSTLTFRVNHYYAWFLLDDVSVTPVPLPSTLLLLGSGLLGLTGLRRFRKK